MVDTLSFLTSNFELTEGEIALFSDHSTRQGGVPINFRMSRNIPGIQVTHFPQRLLIQSSLPKFLLGSNYHELEDDDFDTLVGEMDKRLNGVCNQIESVKDMRVVRLDYSKNLTMGEQSTEYIQAFHELDMPGHGWRKKLTTDNGALSSNWSKFVGVKQPKLVSALVMYDKKAEMEHEAKGKKGSNLKELVESISNNVVRVEKRYFGGQIISKRFHESESEPVRLIDVFDQEKSIADLVGTLRSMVGERDPVWKRSFYQWVNRVEYHKKSNPQNVVNRVAFDVMVSTFMSEFGSDIVLFEKLFKGRLSPSRLREVKKRFHLAKVRNLKPKKRDYIQEVQDKLLESFSGAV